MEFSFLSGAARSSSEAPQTLLMSQLSVKLTMERVRGAQGRLVIAAARGRRNKRSFPVD